MRGCDLVELPAADTCCGFGGTFALKCAETSTAMLGDKIRTSGLSVGSHTVQFVKRSGTWATLDAFEVTGGHNDTDPSVAYTGTAWIYSAYRGLGDYQDDVHVTTANGDSATVTFTGTGISLVTETKSDEGTIAVSLDGASQGTVNAYSRTAWPSRGCTP